MLGLADLAIGAVSQLAPEGVQLPEQLGRLTPTERAVLRPFAEKAAPKLAEYTASMDQYAHWVFLGLVGWFGVVRWQALQRLAKQLEDSRSGASTSSASASSSTGTAADAPGPHPGQLFGARMPGSAF